MHEVSMTNVYCAFNLYVEGVYKRLAGNVHVTQGTCEISFLIRPSQIVRLSYIYCSFSEAQVQRAFSDLARKLW